MLAAFPGASDTNGFRFSSRSWPQGEFHSCCARPGYLLGRLVFDGADTAPFPLSTIMHTSLLASALTSPSLMSSYWYASHVSIFPFWTFFLLHHPPQSISHTLPSPSCPTWARTQESLKRECPSHLRFLEWFKKKERKRKPLTQELGNKDLFSEDVEQDTSSSWALFAHYSNGFNNACPTYLTGTL